MGIDVGKRIIERDDLTPGRGCTRAVYMGLGPREIVVTDPHQISDRHCNGLLDGVESPSGDLLFKPFLLVGREPDVHAGHI
jgi:hypothetical protein